MMREKIGGKGRKAGKGSEAVEEEVKGGKERGEKQRHVKKKTTTKGRVKEWES